MIRRQPALRLRLSSLSSCSRGQPINVKFALKLLEGAGHKVTVAGNGEHAVDLWQGNFDVVLMDVQMPEMDGLDADTRNPPIESPGATHTPSSR